jgi:flotillin
VISALLAQTSANPASTVIVALVVVAMLFVFFIFLWLFARSYVKVGPDQALVVFGRQRRTANGVVGFRIVKSGGAFVLPMIEKYDVLNLQVNGVELAMPDVATSSGAPLAVEGAAQIRINDDPASLAAAAKHFLSGGGLQRRAEVSRQVLEGHVASVAAGMTVQEICGNRAALAAKVREAAAADLAGLGLALVSLNINRAGPAAATPAS